MRDKKRMLAATILILLAAAGTGLYFLGWQRGAANAVSPASQADKASAKVSGERKVLYWHDPMVPGQKFDKPGKSPFMDMQLVPVYADEAHDGNGVSISPRVQQNLGIRTAPVTEGVLSIPVNAVGSVAYNERDVAVVQARSAGFVERLYLRAQLDPVRKGQALADLYVPDWVAAQEEFLAVRRMGEGQHELLDAARQRMRLAGMTERQVGLVESSGKVQARMTVVAPIAGIVTELAAREGMTVEAGSALVRINGLGTVWVDAEVPERLAASVRPGAAVQVTLAARSGQALQGKVSALLPAVDPATRTVKARIELSNPGGQMVPGMFVSVSFAGHGAAAMLLVPTEALIRTGARTLVMVADGQGHFAPVEVATGVEADGKTQITKGLRLGQQVVVSGQFLIDSEASLRGTAHRLSDPAQQGKAPAAKEHRGEGVVEQIDKNEITLSHGPIPTLKWGAMTMGFVPPSQGLPSDVRVGSTVSFSIREQSDGMYQITAIAAKGGAK